MDNGLKSLVSALGFNPCRSACFTPNAIPFGVSRNLVILNPSAIPLAMDVTIPPLTIPSSTEPNPPGPHESPISFNMNGWSKPNTELSLGSRLYGSESLNVNSSSPSESKLGEFKEIRFSEVSPLLNCLNVPKLVGPLLDEST